jgi:prepilin-type processing-associated H-X9-DG protein
MARTIETSSRGARLAIRGLILPCAAAIALNAHAAPEPALHALLVGGGPDKENNTAQIEEHLRFVAGVVPPTSGRIILFADGHASSRDLSYTDSASLTPAQQALDVLLPNDDLGAKIQTRAPEIGAAIDGPSHLAAIDRAMHRLAAISGKKGPPVLLYFAGHGSVAEDKDKTSLYNLWGDEDLDPPTLLHEIDLLPPAVPVTLVMAQCFSGGFANVIFRKANADLAANDRLIIGFFAAESDREAAGCGTETNSPVYQDFSSYFFGALSGRDRLGHKIDGADYDGDGRVSCHEAFCYALLHDDSIDTPVCTSMIFLRRFVDLEDSAIFATPYHTLLETATPAQRAALEGLSAKLGLSGEQRLLAAYDRLMFSDPLGQPQQIREYRDDQDQLNALRMTSLQALFAKWPALRWKDSKDYDKATRGATADLTQDQAKCQELLLRQDAFDRADEALDEEEALLVRYTDIAESLVRARYLREHGDAGVLRRYEQIWRAEQQPLGIALAR